uniref:CKLF like MARVEL transmembrane domain containing 8 n=2 Tax=Passeriformes TaxID=9126 RepID=A0A8C5IZ93_JUNHY
MRLAPPRGCGTHSSGSARLLSRTGSRRDPKSTKVCEVSDGFERGRALYLIPQLWGCLAPAALSRPGASGGRAGRSPGRAAPLRTRLPGRPRAPSTLLLLPLAQAGAARGAGATQSGERRCLRAARPATAAPAMEPPVPPQEQPPRPRSHTVTTTSSSFTANLSASSSTLAYDREFLRTVPGLLMVTEIVLGLLVWTLIAGTEYFLYPAFGWVMFVAVFYWVLTVFFLIIYMTMTYTRIPQVPWTMVGLCFNGSAFVLYLIAAIVDASSVTKDLDSHNYNSWAASSFFAFVVTSCYAGNTYFSFISWQSRTLQ